MENYPPLGARRRKGEEDGKMDTSINVARSCGCIRLLSHRALLEACGKRERKMYIYMGREKEREREFMSGFPRACLLHRSLNFFRSRCYDVSRRLITPRRKYSCTFMAHAYVKFQCRRSSSSSLPSSFTSSLHYPHPSCNAHSLIPVGMYIYIYI